MCTLSSINEKDLDQFGKLLLSISNSTRMFIAIRVSGRLNTNGFACRKHNRNSVIAIHVSIRYIESHI